MYNTSYYTVIAKICYCQKCYEHPLKFVLKRYYFDRHHQKMFNTEQCWTSFLVEKSEFTETIFNDKYIFRSNFLTNNHIK